MSAFLKSYLECPIQFELLRRLYACRSTDEGNFDEILDFVDEHAELKPLAVRAFRELTALSPFVDCPLKSSIEEHGLGVLMHEVAIQAISTITPVRLNCYGLSKERFLDYNCTVAVWMQELAGLMRRDSMKAFVVGLLYTLGMVPLARLLERVKPNLRLDGGLSVGEQMRAERCEAGVDFIQVGVRLLEQWGFPDEVTTPIRNHLHPALSSRHRESAVLLHLSTLMADLSLDDFPVLPVVNLPEHILFEFGLDRVEIANCIPLVATKIRSLKSRMAADAAVA